MKMETLGLTVIDHQHEEILACLRQIREATAQRAGWFVCYQGIDRLRDLCRTHFRVEESLMRMYGYTGADQHGAEHREYEELLSELAVRVVTHPLGEGAFDFLEQWWETHVAGEDRGYVRWFASTPLPGLVRPDVAGTGFGRSGSAQPLLLDDVL